MNGLTNGRGPDGREPLSDEALAEHLRRRGAELAPRELAATIVGRVAETEPERRWRLAIRSWRPAMAALTGAAVLVLVAGVLYFGGPPPIATGPTTWDPNEGPMTVAQLAAVMDGWVPDDAGHVVIVDAAIDSPSPHRGDPCEPAFLQAGENDVRKCVIGAISGPARALNVSAFVPITDGNTHYPTPGPQLVLRLDSREEATLITSYAGDGRPVTVRDGLAQGLIGLSPIKAWLTGQGAVPCPAPFATPDLRTWDQQPIVPGGCPAAALVDRPVTMIGLTGSDYLRLQGGAYIDFAPDQASLDDSGNMAPRQGVFVVLAHPHPCSGIQADSSPDARRCADFELAARLDPLRIGAPATPTPTPSPTVAGLTWDPAQRALTPAELGRILGAHPAVGRVLVVDDAILERMVDCASPADCPNGVLASDPGVVVRPPSGGHLPFPTDRSPITGPVAVRVVDDRSLEFLGSVVGNESRLSFKASDLAARNAIGGLFVIPAWISAGPPPPCPNRPTPAVTSEVGLPAPDVGCVPSVWMTDREPIPPLNGSAPPDGLAVQLGAYDRFAPDPELSGGQSAPRYGVFLVRDWAGYGEVLARLEPMAIPSPAATPEPTTSPSVTGIVMSVDELVRRVGDGSLEPGSIAVADIPASAVSDRWPPGVVHSCPQLCPTWWLTSGAARLAVVVSMQHPVPTSIVGVQAFVVEPDSSLRALGAVSVSSGGTPVETTEVTQDGALWLVHGWNRLGVTQPLPCPAPASSSATGLLDEPLAWSACPGDWIASTAAGSSGPTGTALYDAEPHGALHVQDNAGNPSFDATEGVWLVRWAGCPAGRFCAFQAMPLLWELVGEPLSFIGAGTP